jgi:hypothetical protein
MKAGSVNPRLQFGAEQHRDQHGECPVLFSNKRLQPAALGGIVGAERLKAS